MPRAVLTGGPGAGKTTLLHALAAAGLRIMAESAREVIVERKQQGLPPRPPPADFAREILRRDMLKHAAGALHPGWVVYDRGAVEAIGGVQAIEPLEPPAAVALLDRHRVDRVFILPPWPEIYTTDSERDQTFSESLRVHALTAAWYRQAGYEPIEVPRAPPAERAAWVLQRLAAPYHPGP